MLNNKKISILNIIILLIILLFIPLNVNAIKLYNGNNFSLREFNNDLILSVKSDFDIHEKDVLKFKNFDGMLTSINLQKDFLDNEGRLNEYDTNLLKNKQIPHIMLKGPMEIISLNDNIWFETLLLDKSQNKYNYTGYYYFLDGISEYKVSIPGNAYETKLVKTGNEYEFVNNLKNKKTYHEFLKTRKNAIIKSEKGRLNINGKEKYYSHFLLTGNIRNTDIKLPNILITVDFNNNQHKEKNTNNTDKNHVITNKKSNFSDIKNSDWFFEDVHDLVDKKILKGYSDGSFKPQKEISYGEFLKAALSSATGKELKNKKGEHWAKPYYDEAVRLKVLNKTDIKPTKNNFNKNINREDMAYILININERVQNKDSIKAKNFESEIKDLKFVSNNRKKHVLQAYAKGLIKGKNGKFDPKSHTTRAEAAVVIKRLIEY